jgi:hypothetical protein
MLHNREVTQMSFDHSHYVPILKGKQGEFDALQNIASANHIKAFTPLIEIPPISASYSGPQSPPEPSKTIDKHVANVAEDLIKAVKNLPTIFVDGFYIETEVISKMDRRPSMPYSRRSVRLGFHSYP